MMTRKRYREENSILRSKVNALQQSTISKAAHQQQLGDLQSKLSYLQNRLYCKICFENELGVKVLPCQHVFSCRDCFERTPKTKCIICQGLIQNLELFCLP